MFEKTRQRLVLLNSIVLLIILGSFGTFLYFYMEYRLYREVDETLQHAKTHITREHKGDMSKFIKPEENDDDQRTIFLFWGRNDILQAEIPKNIISEKAKDKLLEEKNSKSPSTVHIGSFYYRTINIPIHHSISINGSTKYVERIQLIYNLEREREMLEHLLVFIEFGSVISVVVAILAGFFLANRALVPIQLAWNKQSQFVADASHELRTPLAVMKLNLERLFRHPKSSIEEESENISQSISEIKYMTKMISELLTLARSDSNQLEIIVSKVQLDTLLNKVVQDFSELARLKGIKMISKIQSPVEILGDKERLYQLFMIILDNALKYTPENGQITVQCNVKGFNAHIVIADTGEGISKEDLPLIFDRFYRGDKARTRKYEGTGLGLSIAKWIIELHGGKIRATSEMGMGTQIIMHVPLNKRHITSFH
ncbi:sensor histidine kinase [Neobacillus sp. GCM10023253]|uniref:sensor histidine kinase n=1 Tax=Neobacillus sp. GCM10023253 TaxID=3252644 RepID=UPI00360B1931